MITIFFYIYILMAKLGSHGEFTWHDIIFEIKMAAQSSGNAKDIPVCVM